MEIKNFHLSKQNLPNFISKLEHLDFSSGYVANVTLKKSKRTIPQNSRLWKLYTIIGEHIGEFPDAVHDLMGWKFLRYQDTVNGESIERIKSTTKLDTEEMALYQQQIEAWGASMGVYFGEV